MRKLIILILIGLSCNSVFARSTHRTEPKDTIDHWQIYLDGKLVLAANQVQDFATLPKVVLTGKNVRLNSKLEIVYRTDTPGREKVEIQIIDTKQRRLSQRYFSANARILLSISELQKIAAGKEIVLYFYRGTLTKPGSNVRGVPVVQVKF